MWWWWWSRRPRVKYSALPLAGGVDETMLRTWTKRSALQTFLYLAVFVLIIISVSFARFAVRKLDFSPIPSIRPPESFELRRPPQSGAGTSSYNSSAILRAQEAAFRLTSRPNLACELKPWHKARYATLRASGSESRTILLALNLVNAASILPSLLMEMPVLLKFLGPHNVHISVYENGSEDFTPELLVSREPLLLLTLPTLPLRMAPRDSTHPH